MRCTRWKLGLSNFTITEEFIGREPGWSSLDARETTSKMMFSERTKLVDTNTWLSPVLNATVMPGIDVKAIARFEKLKL